MLRSLVLSTSRILRKKVGETIIVGNSQLGYFGEIPASQFIDGVSLAAAIGLTQGIAYNNEQPWLKFSHLGKILYIPKKPIRHSTSWNALNVLGAALGGKQILIRGQTYKVRLMTGTNGGEFDTLMYRVHANSNLIPKFASFSSDDLNMGYNNGKGYYNYCQEVMNAVPSWRIARHDVPSSHTNISVEETYDYLGWRPVLELVQ